MSSLPRSAAVVFPAILGSSEKPAAHFMAVFGPYSQRVTQVLHRYDPAVLDQAARHVADDDSEIPLRPEERTR